MINGIVYCHLHFQNFLSFSTIADQSGRHAVRFRTGVHSHRNESMTPLLIEELGNHLSQESGNITAVKTSAPFRQQKPSKFSKQSEVDINLKPCCRRWWWCCAAPPVPELRCSFQGSQPQISSDVHVYFPKLVLVARSLLCCELMSPNSKSESGQKLSLKPPGQLTR